MNEVIVGRCMAPCPCGRHPLQFEWDHPSDIDTMDPTRDTHTFARFVLVEDLEGHPWFRFILNK
jgi:hypothetical protein